MLSWRGGLLLLGLALGATAQMGCGAPRDGSAPSLVLLTLDTTRSDFLGAYGAGEAETPVLDGLAAGGTRYARAISPSPLTLPAHASLLTGLAPPAHGVRDNGSAALGATPPTLAEAFARRGYATGAFVASRVLDRRFGLDRGFHTYDDHMAAEQLGEYGRPERDAAAVTSAAIEWLSGLPASQPYFLWVHYYDPHAPYGPPGSGVSVSPREDYAAEITRMDREIGRLLAALPDAATLVAAVGDHGESLGEHDERGHGLLLHRATLEVPLILHGPGVPAGQVVGQAVATRRLAPTLLALAGAGDGPNAPGGAVLPGLPGLDPGDPGERSEIVYSETWLPARAYGWSPLRAASDSRWRYVEAPRPELYDVAADPGETRNLADAHPDEARRLARALAAVPNPEPSQAGDLDPELAAALVLLGYASGSPAGAMDPKDGVRLVLPELERARELARAGRHAEAAALLRRLAERNPRNVPLWTRLGAAELASGNGPAALTAYRTAVALNPDLDLLHLNLAETLRRLGRLAEARRAYERVLKRNPRSARAWLGLGELAYRAGDRQEERRLLLEAVEAGTASAGIHLRLGQVVAAEGDLEAARSHWQKAVSLSPGSPAGREAERWLREP